MEKQKSNYTRNEIERWLNKKPRKPQAIKHPWHYKNKKKRISSNFIEDLYYSPEDLEEYHT